MFNTTSTGRGNSQYEDRMSVNQQKACVAKNDNGINNKAGIRVAGRFASAATSAAVQAKLDQDKADGKVGGNIKARKAAIKTTTAGLGDTIAAGTPAAITTTANSGDLADTAQEAAQHRKYANS